MIKGISPLTIAAGIAAVSTFLLVGFVCLNVVIYALLDTEPYAEATPLDDRNLITKADF